MTRRRTHEVALQASLLAVLILLYAHLDDDFRHVAP
jgi:hypothetical protein